MYCSVQEMCGINLNTLMLFPVWPATEINIPDFKHTESGDEGSRRIIEVYDNKWNTSGKSRGSFREKISSSETQHQSA